MANRFKKAKEYTERYRGLLLPCCFCGNTDILIVSDRMIFPPKDGWFVACSTPKCDCTGTYSKVKDAIQRWNEMQNRKDECIDA